MNDIPVALYVVGGPLGGTHIPRGPADVRSDVKQSAVLTGNTARLGELEEQLDEALDAARSG